MATWICKWAPLKGWYLIFDDHNMRNFGKRSPPIIKMRTIQPKCDFLKLQASQHLKKILRSTSSNSIFRSTCRKFLVHPFIDTSTTDTDIVRQASIYNTMILNLWNMYLYAFSKLTQNILWVTFIFQLFYCLQAVKKHWKLRMRLFSPAELFKKSLFSTWTDKTFLHWCIGSHGWLGKSCRVHFWATTCTCSKKLLALGWKTMRKIPS